jgi:hypothetical protein
VAITFCHSLDFTFGEVQPQALNLAQTRARSASPDFYLGCLCNYRVYPELQRWLLRFTNRDPHETRVRVASVANCSPADAPVALRDRLISRSRNRNQSKHGACFDSRSSDDTKNTALKLFS